MHSTERLSAADQALLNAKLERAGFAKCVSAILGIVVPLGFCVFLSVTPTDWTQLSTLFGVGLLCVVFAAPFAAIWIDQKRLIVRIGDWLEAGEKSCVSGTVTSKGAHHTITIGETSLRVWHRIYQLPIGHEASVEFLPTNGQPVLHGVLRINGEDNPYFSNAVVVGPPGP